MTDHAAVIRECECPCPNCPSPSDCDGQDAWAALVAERDETEGANESYKAENEMLRAERDAAVDLVRRFRQWDDLPGRADGPYWIREADRVLASLLEDE